MHETKIPLVQGIKRTTCFGEKQVLYSSPEEEDIPKG